MRFEVGLDWFKAFLRIGGKKEDQPTSQPYNNEGKEKEKNKVRRKCFSNIMSKQNTITHCSNLLVLFPGDYVILRF